jgi:hypothetical protein
MSLTRSQLNQIILEEIKAALIEAEMVAGTRGKGAKGRRPLHIGDDDVDFDFQAAAKRGKELRRRKRKSKRATGGRFSTGKELEKDFGFDVAPAAEPKTMSRSMERSRERIQAREDQELMAKVPFTSEEAKALWADQQFDEAIAQEIMAGGMDDHLRDYAAGYEYNSLGALMGGPGPAKLAHNAIAEYYKFAPEAHRGRDGIGEKRWDSQYNKAHKARLKQLYPDIYTNNRDRAGKSYAEFMKDPPKKGAAEEPKFKSEKAQIMWDVGDVFGAFEHELAAGHLNSVLKDINDGKIEPQKAAEALINQYVEGGYEEFMKKDKTAPERLKVLLGTMQRLAAAPPTTGEKPKGTDLTAPSDLTRLRGSPAESAELVDAEEEVIDTVITDPSTKATAEKTAAENPAALASLVTTLAPSAAAGKTDVGRLSPETEKQLTALGWDQQQLANLYKDIKQSFVKAPGDVAPRKGSMAIYALLKQAGHDPASPEARRARSAPKAKAPAGKFKAWNKEAAALQKQAARRRQIAQIDKGKDDEVPRIAGHPSMYENGHLDVAHLLEIIDEEISKFRK